MASSIVHKNIFLKKSWDKVNRTLARAKNRARDSRDQILLFPRYLPRNKCQKRRKRRPNQRSSSFNCLKNINIIEKNLKCKSQTLKYSFFPEEKFLTQTGVFYIPPPLLHKPRHLRMERAYSRRHQLLLVREWKRASECLGCLLCNRLAPKPRAEETTACSRVWAEISRTALLVSPGVLCKYLRLH